MSLRSASGPICALANRDDVVARSLATTMNELEQLREILSGRDEDGKLRLRLEARTRGYQEGQADLLLRQQRTRYISGPVEHPSRALEDSGQKNTRHDLDQLLEIVAGAERDVRLQSIEEAWLRGYREGTADLILQQLNTRFGRLHDSVRMRVLEATLKELVRWGDRITLSGRRTCSIVNHCTERPDGHP